MFVMVVSMNGGSQITILFVCVWVVTILILHSCVPGLGDMINSSYLETVVLSSVTVILLFITV